MKPAMILSAVLVASIGANVARGVQLCPIALYGQWNGVYYYQCKENNSCMTAQPGQSTTPKNLGCPCSGSNIIIPFVVQTETDQKKASAIDETLNQLGKYVRPRKKNYPAGVGEDDDSTFVIKNLDTKHAPGSDQDVFVVTDADGDLRYFRVLVLDVPSIGEARIGQELKGKPSQGPEPKEATIESDSGDYQHAIKYGDTVYKVLTVKPMKKP